jgi:hypothetical protein
VRCPKDAHLLEDVEGLGYCPCCRGRLLTPAILDEVFPGYTSSLQVETDIRSSVFADVHECPECSALMVPLRGPFGHTGVERCWSCDLYWLEESSLRMAAEWSRPQFESNFLSEGRMDEAESEGLEAGRNAATLVPEAHALSVSASLPDDVWIRTSHRSIVSELWPFATLVVVAMFCLAGSVLSAVFSSVSLEAWGLCAVHCVFALTVGIFLEQWTSRWTVGLSLVLAAGLSVLVEGSFLLPEALVAASTGIATFSAALLAASWRKVLEWFELPAASVHDHGLRGAFVLYLLLHALILSLMRWHGFPMAPWTVHLPAVALGVLAALPSQPAPRLRREISSQVAIIEF